MAGVTGGRRGRKQGAPAEPLGSLSTAGRDGAERCSACEGTSLTRVRIVLTDSTPAVFVSCHDCEHKAWYEDGGDGTEHGIDWVSAHSVKKA